MSWGGQENQVPFMGNLGALDTPDEMSTRFRALFVGWQ